ncbi:lipopolysaccharide biosynthesis protein, partial [[Eubacterium] hominis]
MSKNKKLIQGTLIYAIGSFGTKILNFLIVPLYTYYILPGDLGDYDLLMTTVSLISPLITLKISDATYRWIINKKENEKV